MPRAKSLKNRWEKMKKSNRLVTEEVKKSHILTSFPVLRKLTITKKLQEFSLIAKHLFICWWDLKNVPCLKLSVIWSHDVWADTNRKMSWISIKGTSKNTEIFNDIRHEGKVGVSRAFNVFFRIKKFPQKPFGITPWLPIRLLHIVWSLYYVYIQGVPRKTLR